MAELQEHLRDTQIIGSDSRELAVTVETCRELAEFGMIRAGVTDAGDEFRFVRANPQFAAVRVCFAGEGRVMVNGQWRPCSAGMAYITPAGAFHAYHSVPSARWGICWVAYANEPVRLPIRVAPVPTLTWADPRPLHAAIDGLYSEASGLAQTDVHRRWLELVGIFVGRVVSEPGKIDRLWQLWAEVDSRLNHRWTLEELARNAGMGDENLRLICRSQHGRSPMQHVAFLRMRRAAGLLTGTSQKVETIARQVGYADAFSFSTAFKRWAGISPAAYRHRPSKPIGAGNVHDEYVRTGGKKETPKPGRALMPRS